MREWFGRQTLRGKVQIVILATSTIMLLFLFVVQVVLQYLDLRQNVLDEVRPLIESVSEKSAPALLAGDQAAAREVLFWLNSEPKITSGRIYDRNEALFASYGKDLNPPDYEQLELSKQPNASHQYYFSYVCIHHPIMAKEGWLGTLVIQTSLGGMQQSMLRFTMTWGLTIFIAWLASYLLSRKFRNVISEPIERLAAAMKAVSAEKSYSLRIENVGSDELSQLADGFNEMLAQIEQRDRDLTHHRDRMDHLAHHDSLTGLPNRLLFKDRLKQAIQRAERGRRPLALIFIDLDRFKNINDTLGHDIGDIVLVETACRLEQCLRKSDTIARLGGDEFVVILEEIESRQSVTQIARKIIDELSQECQVMQHRLYVTASLGISFYPDHGTDLTTLKRCADIAMFKAKELGRDNYQIYTPGMEARTQELLVLENDLREALGKNQLSMYFQPQISMKTGKVCAAEALLRWQHPTRGLVLPGEFIPLAEQTGLIVELGDWALQDVCRQARAWLDKGLGPIGFTVNVSPRQFRQDGLFATVRAALEETGLPAHLLELEVTEPVLMDDVEEVVAKMTKLRELGVTLAIDDFGSGYASLSYLKYLPVSKLKIDMSFIRDLHKDKYDLAIATSVTSLARIMGLQSLAAGVENAEQESTLLSLGMEWAQGFFYQRPMEAEQFEAFLRQAEIFEGAGQKVLSSPGFEAAPPPADKV